MAFYSNQEANSRAHWAGANASVDVHNEMLEALIEHGVRQNSQFTQNKWTQVKYTEGNTNTIGHRMIGGTTTGVRQYGELLEPKRIVNEKVIMKVDRAVYTQVQTDFFDDWTAPSFSVEYAAEAGHAQAKEYDTLHMRMLIKAPSWTPPASLTTRFPVGQATNMNGYNALTTREAKAKMIADQHSEAILRLTKNDVDRSGLITLVSPDIYHVLSSYWDGQNALWQATGAVNDAARRKLVHLNGIPVYETNLFPTGAVASSPMGSQFNLSADEARGQIVIFDPRKVLITPTAKELYGFTETFPSQLHTLMTTIRMFNVGHKNGGSVQVLRPAA